MNFATAVKRTPSISEHLKGGLQALHNVDRRRVSCEGRNLRGSVAIDDALRRSHPNAARWDYAVGFGRERRHDSIVWLEVHPASSHHIGEVLDKLDWLKHWMRDEAPELGRFPRCFCWIASGAISFGRGGPQAKNLAEAGLRFPVKQADIERLFEQQ